MGVELSSRFNEALPSLNAGQQDAARKFHQWIKNKDKPTFEISGPAGSGKTFLIRHLLELEGIDLKQVLFVAYVGKATLALAKNGLNASTIHSAFYTVVHVPLKDKKGNFIIKEDGSVACTFTFIPKKELDPEIHYIVVDEGSMVPEHICEHILSYKIPVIVMGDLNQLEPVFGSPMFLKKPDVVLTEIMRQEKGSPIIYLANEIIRGYVIRPGKLDSEGKVQIVSSREEAGLDYFAADVVICGKNKTRCAFNSYMRNFLKGIKGISPVVGDKVICRKNNWDIHNRDGLYLVNGLTGFIRDIDYEHTNRKIIRIDFEPDEFASCFYNIDVDRRGFEYTDGEYDRKLSMYDVFEYGYAITCHLAQGSQYRRVIVKHEVMKKNSIMQNIRWLYTAVTRAIDSLILII